MSLEIKPQILELKAETYDANGMLAMSVLHMKQLEALSKQYYFTGVGGVFKDTRSPCVPAQALLKPQAAF